MTASGHYFDFTNTESNVIEIEDIAHALSNVCRFGGHVSTFYSVAQHSVLVSREVQKRQGAFSLHGLMHDAGEAYIGDVPKPLKLLLPDYQAIEERVDHAIRSWSGLPRKMPPVVKEVDTILLATEQRDLMPRLAEQWASTAGVTPLSFKVRAWSPRKAYRLFMDRWYELHGKGRAYRLGKGVLCRLAFWTIATPLERFTRRLGGLPTCQSRSSIATPVAHRAPTAPHPRPTGEGAVSGQSPAGCWRHKCRRMMKRAALGF